MFKEINYGNADSGDKNNILSVEKEGLPVKYSSSSRNIHIAADLLHIALKYFKRGASSVGNSDTVLAAECMDDFTSHLHARPIFRENKKEAAALVRGFLKHYKKRLSRIQTLDLCNDIYAELDETRALRIPNHKDQEYSNYCYPENYKGARAINEQIDDIANLFGLDPRSALEFVNKKLSNACGEKPTLPDGAEDWFAIPSVKTLREKYFPEASDPNDIYCRSLNLAHLKLNISRNFYTYLSEGIHKDRLKVLPRTLRAFEEIENAQNGDILVIPAQLGLRYRGKSPNLAKDSFGENEYGLDSFSLCSILLTNPDLIVHWKNLGIECPGNVFDYYNTGLSTHTPTYSFRGTGVRAYHIWNWDGYANYGSATFFTN